MLHDKTQFLIGDLTIWDRVLQRLAFLFRTKRKARRLCLNPDLAGSLIRSDKAPHYAISPTPSDPNVTF